MPFFRYEALDNTGQAHTGEIEAEDVAQAAVELAAQSLVVLSIELVQPLEPSTEPITSSALPTDALTVTWSELIVF